MVSRAVIDEFLKLEALAVVGASHRFFARLGGKTPK
jgi:hypothetical protein